MVHDHRNRLVTDHEDRRHVLVLGLVDHGDGLLPVRRAPEPGTVIHDGAVEDGPERSTDPVTPGHVPFRADRFGARLGRFRA